MIDDGKKDEICNGKRSYNDKRSYLCSACDRNGQESVIFCPTRRASL